MQGRVANGVAGVVVGLLIGLAAASVVVAFIALAEIRSLHERLDAVESSMSERHAETLEKLREVGEW